MRVARDILQPGYGALGIIRSQLGRQASWLAIPFAVQQAVRLVTSIVLARLLAPEVFGLMLLVNTLRAGTELLSDIGIGQSVVRSRHAEDIAFLDTAWTLQLVRGAVLFGFTLLVIVPVAGLYGYAQLETIVALVSVVFLFTGAQSPSLFLMQRDQEIRGRAVYDVICTIVQCVGTIALALAWPTVWSLIWGLILSTLFSTLLSFAFGARRLPRLALDRAHTAEILHFGKWVFLATAIYFAAISADKIYFGAALPLAVVGVYGVARNFADIMGQLAQRVGGLLVFPKVVALRADRELLGERLRYARRLALGGVALGLALAMAGSDELMLRLYDDRYRAAAFMLPLLLPGVWFAVLAIFAESTLLGIDRPAPAAAGNAVKLAILLGGLPLALGLGDLYVALLVLALAEVGRWLTLSYAARRDRLAFVGEEALFTAALFAAGVALKVSLGWLGVVPTLAEWWALGVGIHG